MLHGSYMYMCMICVLVSHYTHQANGYFNKYRGQIEAHFWTTLGNSKDTVSHENVYMYVYRMLLSEKLHLIPWPICGRGKHITIQFQFLMNTSVHIHTAS